MRSSRFTRCVRRPFRPLLETFEERVVPAFDAALAFDAGDRPVSVAVGDVNGDGLLDLAVANYNSANVSVLLGNGDGTFAAAQHFDAGDRPRSVAVADVNGDGLLDLAVANEGTPPFFTNGSVSVLLGNGDGTFAVAQHFAAGSGTRFVTVGDVNGDTLLDLIVLSGTVRVLLGHGDGTFQTTHVSYAGGVPLSVALADFNGDTFPDGVTANFESNDVSILLNDGVWTGPGGAPGPGGDSAPFASDLFAEEELARIAGRLVQRQAAPTALPDAGPRQAPARVPSEGNVAPLRTMGTSPAARRDRAHAVRDLLFTPPEEYGLGG